MQFHYIVVDVAFFGMTSIPVAQQVVLQNRPQDYLYDPTFTVAGPVDHHKQVAQSRDQQVVTMT